MMISKVRGRFARWGGTILMDEENPAQSSVEVVIDASSIDTGLEARDADLRSPNFLDVKHYPQISSALFRNSLSGSRPSRRTLSWSGNPVRAMPWSDWSLRMALAVTASI